MKIFILTLFALTITYANKDSRSNESSCIKKQELEELRQCEGNNSLEIINQTNSIAPVWTVKIYELPKSKDK